MLLFQGSGRTQASADRNQSHNRRTRSRARRPEVETLEERVILSTGLPSTTVAGASVGQTVSNLVNNAALGGLTVASTANFGTSIPSNFLLLGQGGSNFAFVQYSQISGESFTGLSLPAGNGQTVLSSSTTVAQAPNGTTPAGNAQPLSNSPFSLQVHTTADTFSDSGYLYVQGAHGNEIVQYTSQAFASGVTTFDGCTIVGTFGTLTGSPFTDQVNAGSFIVQAVAPAPGQTTSINATAITVAPNTAFSLPVVSATGFTTPTPGQPGYALVYYTPTTPAVVSYTGIEANPSGGFNLTGCQTPTAGTINAYGAGAPSANVLATSAAPMTFAFTNNTGQVPVYVAIAGQEIDTTTGASSYGYLAPQSTNGSPDFSKPWQFETLAGLSSVPTYQIFGPTTSVGATQNLLIPNDPYSRLDSVRLIFSVGSPPSISIVNGQPSFPAPGNPSDPNNNITYDFVEFTERSAPNDGVLFINTTQVDQVGIPFTMQTNPIDSVKANGVGITVSRPTLFTNYGTYLQTQFGTSPQGAARLALSAFQALVTPNRLLNPSDAISNPPSSAVQPLSTYFDAALVEFFNRYATAGQTFRLQRDGFYFSGQTVTNFSPPPASTAATNNGQELLVPPNGNAPSPLAFAVGQVVSGPGVPTGATIQSLSVDSGNVTHLTLSQPITAQAGTPTYSFQVPHTYVVLQLKQTDSSGNEINGGQQYQIYAPFFNLGSGGDYPAGFIASGPMPPPPPWIVNATSGAMVFGNLGAFSDGAVQAANGQISGTGATGQILLDIENTIVSAFNRGIANAVPPGTDVTAAWDNNATYYPQPNGTGTNWSNLYAGYLHNGGVSITAPGSSVGLAYGFAYDDQGGNDPTLTSFASQVSITLNALVDPTTTRAPRFFRRPLALPVGRNRDAVVFTLWGAKPRTRYVVHVLEEVNGVERAVRPPRTVRSDPWGRIRLTRRDRIIVPPGHYKIVVQNPDNTYASTEGRILNLRRRFW